MQWVKGLETLYDAGVRTFVEVGPKRALRGFVARCLQLTRMMCWRLMTIHPKTGDLPTFNQALCGLYAAGYTGENGAAAAACRRTGRGTGNESSAPPVPSMEGGAALDGNALDDDHPGRAAGASARQRSPAPRRTAGL